MKKEPLKNKKLYTASIFKSVEREYGVNFVGKELYERLKGGHFAMELYEEKDIKSAVEWLKEEIGNMFPLAEYEYKTIIKGINRAFEDVISAKKESNENCNNRE